MSINNQNTNGIVIDKEKFKKVSKKLHSALKKIDHTILKLTEVQEIFANSLGFRNVFEFQNNIDSSIVETQKEIPASLKAGSSLVQQLTTSQKIKFLQFILKYHKKDMGLDEYEEDKHLYIIETLKFFQNYTNEIEIPQKLKTFINCDFSYQSICSISQYDEFIESLNFMKKVNNTRLVAKVNEHVNNISKERYESEKEYYLEYLLPFKFFNNHNFEIYNKSWFNFFTEYEIKAIANIRNIPDFYLSWFEIPIYNRLISLLIEQGVESFSMTDLAVYITKVIDPHKKELLIQLLDILVEHHEFVKNFTLDINNIMKRKNSVSLFDDGNI
jgi:L-fucose mutarotase/ribose pyranase (RbsD/FucU family)